MIMCDQNSDFVHWVLGFDPYSYTGYNHGCEIIEQQNDANEICYNEVEDSNIENDEVIARTLQEEFSQLAVTENECSQHSSSNVYDTGSYGYSALPIVNYPTGYDDQQDTFEYSVPFSHSVSEESLYSLELTDESVLGGEAGQRFNQMIRIPHVPRVNGDIPSEDEAVSDHERLLNRLQLYEFVERKVHGDGNCQFRALSDQLHNTPENHKNVRQRIVNQLKAHPKTYQGYVPMDYSEYVKNMASDGEWGDHVTLQAAADTYRVKIFVITSFKDTCSIEILPKFQKSKGVIFLSFWAEVHYNSISLEGGELKKKKKWWGFGN